MIVGEECVLVIGNVYVMCTFVYVGAIWIIGRKDVIDHRRCM